MVVNAEIETMKKKVGRPSKGGPGTMLQPRLSDEFLEKLDDWRRQQPDLPSRTEALRRLVEQALSSKGGKK
jgi:hypothetical protein